MSGSTKSETQSTAQRGAEVPATAAASPPDQLREASGGNAEVSAVEAQVSAPGGVELSEEELGQVSGGAKFTPSMLTGQSVRITGTTQISDLARTDKEPAWGTDEDQYGR